MTALEKAKSDNIGGFEIDRLAILKELRLDPRNPKAQALVLVCEQYGLDPILKHAVLVDGNLYVTRDGLLHVAHRSGVFDGMEVVDGPTLVGDYWQAKVSVWRKDMSRPFTFVGRYPAAGSNKRYAPEMAVKCAEVMAFRRAFDVALAAREEVWDIDQQPTSVETASAERKAERGPAPSDPWAGVEIAKPPVVTDAVWFSKWRERTALAGTVGELRGLHGEMVEQHKTRNLTDDDRRDAETLLGEMREQVQSEGALITETEPAA